MTTNHEPRQLLHKLFRTTVASADPERLIVNTLLPAPPEGRTVVVGAGKGSAAMALALEQCSPESLSGIVLTPYGHARTCRQIEILEAAHPIPDKAGVRAAKRILNLAKSLREGDRLLCLFSGGGSALLTLPIEGLSLVEKQQVNQQLLASGADIFQINCVRKHLSQIKGGRLAEAAWPASTFSLMISDVPGDDPSVIASGPTVPDDTSCGDALTIIDQYGLTLHETVKRALCSGTLETPNPGAHRLSRSDHRIIASPTDGLRAAARLGQKLGFEVCDLGDKVVGESSRVGSDHGKMLRELINNSPAETPLLLLSGGETTVTVTGNGRGGPNREYLLAAALELDGTPGAWGIACDTDGIDGSHDAAGAVIGPDTLARAGLLGLDPQTMLAENDAGTFFSRLNDAVVTGPTRTNINDFRALIYIPRR